MAGWIKISKDIVNHWLWQEKPFSKGQAWIDLLVNTAWKDSVRLVRGIRVEYHRGDVCLSVREMCERWGWSNGKTIRYLNELETAQQITQQKSNVINTYSIINYDKYQVNNTTDNTTNDTTNDTTDGVTDGTTLNIEEIKNKELINNISSKDDKSGFGETPTLEPVNFNELVKYFNETTKGCFGLLRLPLGDARKKQIRARVATYGKKSLQTMIVKAVASDFLRGDNHRGFVASFDWMIKPRNYEKILSGNYDNRKGQQSERDNIGSNFVNRE